MTTKDQPWISPLSGEDMEFVKFIPGVPDTWEEAFLWYMQEMLITDLDEKLQLGADGKFRLRGQIVTHQGFMKRSCELLYGAEQNGEIVWMFHTRGGHSKLVDGPPDRFSLEHILKLHSQFPEPTPEALRVMARAQKSAPLCNQLNEKDEC